LAIDLITKCRECSLQLYYLIDLVKLFVGTPQTLTPSISGGRTQTAQTDKYSLSPFWQRAAKEPQKSCHQTFARLTEHHTAKTKKIG
jgi:hypothetical protein